MRLSAKKLPTVIVGLFSLREKAPTKNVALKQGTTVSRYNLLGCFQDRPLKLTYGDDTEFTDDEVAELVDIYDDYGMKIDWKVGEAALVSCATSGSAEFN